MKLPIHHNRIKPIHPNWENKCVLITGHTGFKGGWLSLWLNSLGAKVHGLALSPNTDNNFYECVGLNNLLEGDHRCDIRDLPKLRELISTIEPEIIFHLAAQPLVRESYLHPLETYTTNIIGTANLFETMRSIQSVRAVVVVTTDKCYENYETHHHYVEGDRLGGHDPYSSSKACVELLTQAYRKSFFETAVNPIQCATARAGNVIGGGDWAENRLIPDCIRAFDTKESITLRYPHALRPWQHVLESISGYLVLGESLLQGPLKSCQFAEAWNFGPNTENIRSVSDIIHLVKKHIDLEVVQSTDPNLLHEATYLLLDSTKANKYLNWSPRWGIEETITETIHWYQAWRNNDDMLTFSLDQIGRYQDSTEFLCVNKMPQVN